MAQESSPAYQWFVKDWRSSRATLRMTFSERGVYREMLDEQWENLTLPDTPEEVADLIATTDIQRAEVLSAWFAVRRKFADVEGQPGRIQNLRLERIRKEKRAFIRGSRKGGKSSVAQAVRDERGAFQPRAKQSPSDSQAVHQASTNTASASSSASATASADLSARAGHLLESYGEWFSKYRKGAKLRLLHNSLEFQDAYALVALWSDERLEKLARIVLTTDDPFITGTDRSFKIFALKVTWADDRLRQAESGAA